MSAIRGKADIDRLSGLQDHGRCGVAMRVHSPIDCELGSRLIKSTIQGLRRGRQRQGNFARACLAGCDPPEVLQPVEGTFDAPAQLVETRIETERLFSIALVWNDRLGSTLMEFGAQFRAVVGLVTERMF